MKRSILVSGLIAGAILSVGTLVPLLAQNTAKTPAAANPSAAATQSAEARFAAEARAAQQEVEKGLDGKDLRDLLDPAVRKEVGPKIIPPLRKLTTLMQQEADRRKEDVAGERSFLLGILTLLGDEQTVTTLEKTAKDGKGERQVESQVALQLGQWLKSSKDQAAQEKVLGEMQKISTAHPDSDKVGNALMVMSKLGAVNADLAKKAEKMMGAPEEGQPFAFAGPTIDGKKFSSADYKGKVVLVDFWATWCPPCREELPNVVKIYQKYKDKGLVIVGVSLDRTAEDLKDFLAKNPDLSWPQIFDPKQPLANRSGVEAIPTMFLIDKNGVLRTTEARGKLEELIPKMLEEKAKDEKK